MKYGTPPPRMSHEERQQRYPDTKCSATTKSGKPCRFRVFAAGWDTCATHSK